MKTLIDKSDPYLLGPNKQEINFEAQPLFGELESEKKCFVPTKKRREGTQGPASPLPLWVGDVTNLSGLVVFKF